MREPIPLTRIVKRYRALPKSRKGRLALAELLVEQPHLLAGEFAESVREFERYENYERFHGARPRHEPHPTGLRRTIDLALRLEQAGGLVPAGVHAGAMPDTARSGQVRAVDAEDLAVDYCDREIVAARTTGGVRFTDDSSPTSALRLDLLLVSRQGRVPVVGEVKIKADKDPFAALVQALACAAHLATPAQYERLRRCYPEAGFAPTGEAPVLDLYLIVVDFPERGTYLPELLATTRALSAHLLGDPSASKWIRRIACLDVQWTGSGLDATARFAFDRGR